jgi:hypothetical protein
MAQIDQIQVRFVPTEDRILVRIATKDHAEYLFWMTRRYVRLMWPGLTQTLQQNPRISVQPSPDARRELLAFEHQKAVSAADFATPYRETDKTHPLGQAPILLVRLQLRPLDAQHAQLSVGPETGPGLDLTLNQGLLHSFAELLSMAVARADWDLGPLTPRAEAAVNVANQTVN